MPLRYKDFLKNFRTIVNQVPIPPFVDQHDYRESVFISGSGRSGTTWLQEIINYRNEYRMMFEPFYPEKVEVVREWHPFQYLNQSNDEAKFILPATDILSGNVRNRWIDKYNKRLFSQKRLIKDIRANLFLFWIKDKFPEIPMIHILRHPCAVANSKLQGKWDSNLVHYLSQMNLLEDFLHPVEKEIRTAHSEFEKHIFSWCIENAIPLNQFKKGEILITFYENLCTMPEDEIKDIFAFLGKPYSSRVLSRVSIPSLETTKRSAIISGSDLVSAWRKNITQDQIRTALEIMSLFGMDHIYNDTNLPLIQRPEIFSAQFWNS